MREVHSDLEGEKRILLPEDQTIKRTEEKSTKDRRKIKLFL